MGRRETGGAEKPQIGQASRAIVEVARVRITAGGRGNRVLTWTRRTFLCTTVFAATAFAACGPSNPPPSQTSTPSTVPTPGGILPGIFLPPPTVTPSPTPEPTRLRFGFWQSDAIGSILATLASDYGRANPRVVVETVRQPYARHLETLAVGGSSGNGLDVALDSGEVLETHRAAGRLLDLAPLARRDQVDLARYWTDPSTRLNNSALSALPLWIDADVVFYNRDLFAAAKLAEPGDAWTWTDYLAAAERLSDGKPGQMTRWGALVVNDVSGGWGSFVASNGGDFLDPATRKTALGSPAASAALRFVRDAIVAHHAAPRPSEQSALTGVGQTDPFLNGAVAMLFGGSWLMGGLVRSATFHWDVAPLPRAPTTNRSAPTFAAQPAVIARTTRAPDEAWAFLRSLIGPDAQRAIARAKARLPSLKDVASDATSGYAVPPPVRVVVVPTSLASAHDLQFLPGWSAWRSAVVAALEPAFDARADFDAALQQAIADGNMALEKGKSG